MIKVISILLLLNMGLFANYTQALSLYKQGKYKQAIMKAKASKKDYTNPYLHLVWGDSEKMLGNIENAMHAYERVLMLDKQNTRAKNALKDIYAKTERIELLEKMSPTETFRYAGRGMRQHSKKPFPKSIHSTIVISGGYDNNLNATPGSTVLSNYFGSYTNINQVSSLFIRALSDISYSKQITSDWYVKSIIRTYVQSNFSAHLYDFSSVTFEAALGYKQKNYELYFPFSYHRVHYLDKDFLEQYRFSPSILISVGENIILNISTLYSKNDNLDSIEQARDEETFGTSIGGYYLFGKHYTYISVKAEHRIAQHEESAKFVSANFFTLAMGMKYYFTPNLYGKLDYSFRYGRYTDEVGLSVTTRDDNLHQLNTKIGYAFTKYSEFFILEAYSQNLSNYEPVEYKKHTTMFGVTFKY